MIDKQIENILKSINPEYIMKLNIKQFSKYLVEKMRIFKSERDLKLFILEYIGKTFEDDNTDFPIRYYEVNDEKEEKKDMKYEGVQMQITSIMNDK